MEEELKIIKECVKKTAELRKDKDSLDGDEVEILADMFQIELNWDNGNITPHEYQEQLEDLCESI